MMQHIILYAHVRACGLNDIGEELKLFQSTPKEYVFGLLIIVIIVL